jgi:hypothetical protein
MQQGLGDRLACSCKIIHTEPEGRGMWIYFTKSGGQIQYGIINLRSKRDRRQMGYCKEAFETSIDKIISNT